VFLLGGKVRTLSQSPKERIAMSLPITYEASAASPVRVESHPGYRRVFRERELTIGLILPLETHPHSPQPSMRDHIAIAQRAEELGVAALWARDIPFFDPAYGDVGQIFEPLIYIAHLATATRNITLGTAGIVLPMREPLLLAKQINSLDQLTGGRLVIGMSSGDRPSEYPIFGIDFETRGERFREAFGVYRNVSESSFPRFSSARFGQSNGALDMLPKPPFGRTPAIAVGRSQQSLAWIAEHMDGFLGFVPDPDELSAFGKSWRDLTSHAPCGEHIKPLAFGGFLYLHPNPNHPFKRIRGGFAMGSRALRDFLEQARDAGVNHVALNPKVTPRPYSEILDELGSMVLPTFSAS
jgi:luciferase-type oxidoreductase